MVRSLTRKGPIDLCWENVIVTINGHPDIRSILVLNFHTVRIALIPAFENFAFGEFTDVGIDHVTYPKSEILCFAFHQPGLQGSMVEIPANEDESALPFLIVFPQPDLLVEVSS